MLAIAGLGCLCFRNTISSSRRLALVFGLGTLVPCLLALGENLPGYGLLWRNTPLHATRVPERMLPIACLCLAALAAVAIACVSETQARSRLVAAVALVLVAADLWVPLYDPLNADEGNAVYARVADAPPGRLLELPVWHRTSTPAASTSTTRCRLRGSGRSGTRPPRRRRRFG